MWLSSRVPSDQLSIMVHLCNPCPHWRLGGHGQTPAGKEKKKKRKERRTNSSFDVFCSSAHSKKLTTLEGAGILSYFFDYKKGSQGSERTMTCLSCPTGKEQKCDLHPSPSFFPGLGTLSPLPQLTHISFLLRPHIHLVFLSAPPRVN